jgi:hypothetical protein
MARTQVLTGYTNKTVASSLVPEKMIATQTFVKSFIVESLVGNTDYVYIGDATNQTVAIAPGKALTVNGDNMDNGTSGKIDLSTVYVKVNVNGEGVAFMSLVGL